MRAQKLVFELGRYLFGARVGLLGSAIFALAPLQILQPTNIAATAR